MRFFLALVMCLCITSYAYSAELLVKAKPHYLDSLNAEKAKEVYGYEARLQEGDVVVVKPDGWEWGKEECLPNFIVVKVPTITEVEAKKYEESLTKVIPASGDEPSRIKILKVRKYALPKGLVDNAKDLSQTNVSLAKTELTTQLITKTQ